MINTLVKFQVEAAKTHEFEAQHRALLQSMSGKKGCIEIVVNRSLKTPGEYVVYGTWESKEAWDRAHQTEEFRNQFQELPIQSHTLSSSSFFELAYRYNGKKAR
jgi:quinol monooxygenase YgiN